MVAAFLATGILTNTRYIARISDIMPRPKIAQLSSVHMRIISILGRRTTKGETITISDLVADLNLAGASSIIATLKVMERNGFLRILGGGSPGKRCSIVLTLKGKTAAGIGGIPIVGSIPAGPIAEAIEHYGEIIDLGTALPHRSGDFLLKVIGQSMIGDGILDGDLVLLRPGLHVQNGEIAAVQVGEEQLATLKHVCFGTNEETVTLRASNNEYADLVMLRRELRIAGVYRGLVRSI